MRRLSFLILGVLFSMSVFSQKNPHGKQLKIDCSECHTTGSWRVNSLTSTFNHNQTGFTLIGQHGQIDCKMCHLSLTFSEEKGKTDCASCHLDVHQQTLGNDCALCHTPQSWIITDVKEIHFNSRFPLVGAHANADCFDCHLTENLLQFRPLGIECVDCHRAQYLATTLPNHQLAGYSTDCFDCHNMRSAEWNAGGFEHSFFPLTEGHAVNDCAACHSSGNFGPISPICETCHLKDYNASVEPPHATLNFSVNCLDCHTTHPGWSPATFDNHNDFYVLEGAHAAIASDCMQCHSAGYVNTPNTCFACHTDDYNNTSNPSHSELNFGTDCTECHSQNAWTPSSFDHNSIYVLEGAHATIANDCLKCHSTGYANTPNTCYGCHANDYNNTNDPSHSAANFPTDCTECHTQKAWKPSTFDHDGQYFPIYSGSHRGQWNSCTDCHTTANNYTLFSCIDCHEHNKTDMDSKHREESGYVYYSINCLDCHPNGKAD